MRVDYDVRGARCNRCGQPIAEQMSYAVVAFVPLHHGIAICVDCWNEMVLGDAIYTGQSTVGAINPDGGTVEVSVS